MQVGVGLYGLLALLQRRVRQRHAVRRFAENVRHSLGEHPRRQHLYRASPAVRQRCDECYDATQNDATMEPCNQRTTDNVSIDVPLADGGGRPWEYA